MGPSRRSFLTTTGGILLARGVLQDAPAAHAGTTALAGEVHAGRTSFGVNLHLDRFPPATAFLQLAHAKAAGVRSVRGLDAALATV
jgi:hypothetical protein